MFEGDLFCLCRPVSCAREVAAGKEPARVETVARNTQWAVGKFGRQVGNSRVGMGNQQGKGGKRAAPGQTYPFDEPEKKSRTDWTAGNSRLI